MTCDKRCTNEMMSNAVVLLDGVVSRVEYFETVKVSEPLKVNLNEVRTDRRVRGGKRLHNKQKEQQPQSRQQGEQEQSHYSPV